MNLLFDSFWRSLAYCLHPRVIGLSFLPLVLMVALSLGLGYFYWASAVDWVFALLQESMVIESVVAWLQSVGAGNLKMVLAPLLVIIAATPVIVVLSLLLVALLMAPAMARLVAQRRFPTMERKQGGSLVGSVVWSLGSTLLALIALVVSVPLWLVPPLILVLPPLIWGWLTYRVMAFDALAEHASAQERREIFRKHRGWLLGMGIFCGYLGIAPSLIWASGALFVAFFALLVPVAIWINTLIFALSSLWFSHYCLAALQALRAEKAATTAAAAAGPAPVTIDVQAVTLHHDNPSDPPRIP